MKLSIMFVTASLFVAAGCGHEDPTSHPDTTSRRDAASEVSITYVDQNGDQATVLAVPGEVLLFSAGPSVPASDVESVIKGHGGQVLQELPEQAVYIVSVAAGAEAQFISSVRGSSAVLDVLPNLVVEPQAASLGVIDFFTGQVDPHCSMSHGEAVSRVLGSPSQFVIGGNAKGGAAAAAAVAQGAEALATQGPTVLNVSVGAPDLPTETAFLNSLGTQLGSGGINLANTVVVLSSGNDGMDLGPALKKLFNAHPKLVGHLVVVGSAGSAKNCVPLKSASAKRNFSSIATDSAGNPLMIYAPGENIQIPGSGCPPVSGTSFAAPAVAKGLQATLGAHPNTSLADVVKQYLSDAAGNNFVPPTICPPPAPTQCTANGQAPAQGDPGQCCSTALGISLTPSADWTGKCCSAPLGSHCSTLTDCCDTRAPKCGTDPLSPSDTMPTCRAPNGTPCTQHSDCISGWCDYSAGQVCGCLPAGPCQSG